MSEFLRSSFVNVVIKKKTGMNLFGYFFNTIFFTTDNTTQTTWSTVVVGTVSIAA